MHEALGQLIRAKRAAAGLDQAVIAAHLGLGQQAISKWENGTSRPRRSMLAQVAKLLGADEGELLTAGNYLAPLPPEGLPVQPRPVTLPYSELPADYFEHICTVVMGNLHPEGYTSRFGGQGETQDGIDIFVVADGAMLATGQCKRYKTFGKAKVKKAIEELKSPAPQNYLFLARTTATVDARQEAAKHKGWELWDGEDISRYIQHVMPLDRAVRLVRTYFEAHCATFLGYPDRGPFLLPEEHFTAVQGSLYNHEGDLIGRTADVDVLAALAFGGKPELGFLVAAGGMGKTRVLRAVAEAAPTGSEVRVLHAPAVLTAADFELLPASIPLTVLIDDAHELEDVANVVTGIWRRNADANILVATRPHALRHIKEALGQRALVGADTTEVHLGDLEREDAEALARQALGGDARKAVVARLAQLTSDSPLATVLGGSLIRQGKLDTIALEQNPDVKQEIMRLFKQAVVDDPVAPDRSVRLKVVDALAAIQPFRSNDNEAREVLAAIVGIPYDEASKHLGSLEAAGVVRRRGESLRLVPDLLGDAVLVEAAYDGTALGTGYLARIEPMVVGASLEHLFVNTNRVDWQMRHTDAETPDLVGDLWASYQARIEAADIVGRADLCESLSKVAFFQPERALSITRWLIDNPIDHLDPENQVWRHFAKADYKMVLEALPEVIKVAALTAETLPEALAQLWELAQDDHRRTNQHPNHPLRVLKDLAGLGVNKPIWFNDMVYDIAAAWFANGQALSPFEVLKAALATHVTEAAFTRRNFTIRRFAIDPERVARLRQRVIDLAFSELDSDDLSRAGAAAAVFNDALRAPAPVEVESGNLTHDWRAHITQTITRLGDRLAFGGLDAAVLVTLRGALYWHGTYGQGHAHDAAARALSNINTDVETDLGLVLHDGWGRLLWDKGDDFEVLNAKGIARAKSVIERLADLTEDNVVELVITRLVADQTVAGEAGQPANFIDQLVRARPPVGSAMLRHISANAHPTALDRLLPVILSSLGIADTAQAIVETKKFLGSNQPERRRAAAQALGTNRVSRPFQPGELDLLVNLAKDPDPDIRIHIACGAQIVAQADLAAATQILAHLRFGDRTDVADAYFMGFRPNRMDWNLFSAAEIVAIYDDLTVLPNLNDYLVQAALANRSGTHPEEVVSLLTARIERQTSEEPSEHYEALPDHWDRSLKVRETEQFSACLNRVIVWLSNHVDDYAACELGADLFAAIANDYDDQVLETLTAGITSGDVEVVWSVIAVIKEAPGTLVWDQPAFVQNAIDTTGALGEDIRNRLLGAFIDATTTGSRAGIVGEPYPETLRQRDRSREVAARLPVGSIARKLYEDLVAEAEQDVIRELAEDRFSDGRDW